MATRADAPLRWDLFCRVIDNFGDVGVCWRLAADLGARGHAVRLWIDDASALTWMAPRGAPGVTVRPWPAGGAAFDADGPLEVVVEAFGCEPPPAVVARMAAQAAAGLAPAWINLEYLSAEPYVERSHGLPSPVLAGPGRGLTRHFFYPGFTAATGGLLREPGLLEARQAFDRGTWLQARGLPSPAPGERLVTAFAYPGEALQTRLPALAALLAGVPTRLLAAAGDAQPAWRALAAGTLRVHALPWLTQTDFDRLLWCGDLNLVRGEDSFVRAQWAGAPFVWQIYPQDDGVHAAKLEAFLDRFLGDADAALAAGIRALWRGWNGLGPMPGALPDVPAWTALARRWRDGLAARPDLTSRLVEVARARLSSGSG